jgi:hypothetical protein
MSADRYDAEARRLGAEARAAGALAWARHDPERAIAAALRAAERRGAERLRREAVEEANGAIGAYLGHGGGAFDWLTAVRDNIATIDIDALLAEET